MNFFPRLELPKSKYKCEICGKEISRSSDLSRHKRERHGDPTRCPIPGCPWHTKRKERLKDHLKKPHGIQCRSLPLNAFNENDSAFKARYNAEESQFLYPFGEQHTPTDSQGQTPVAETRMQIQTFQRPSALQSALHQPTYSSDGAGIGFRSVQINSTPAFSIPEYPVPTFNGMAKRLSAVRSAQYSALTSGGPQRIPLRNGSQQSRNRRVQSSSADKNELNYDLLAGDPRITMNPEASFPWNEQQYYGAKIGRGYETQSSQGYVTQYENNGSTELPSQPGFQHPIQPLTGYKITAYSSNAINIPLSSRAATSGDVSEFTSLVFRPADNQYGADIPSNIQQDYSCFSLSSDQP